MYIWVVEIKFSNRWETTTGVALNERDGIKKLEKCKQIMPLNELRLEKYTRINR